MTKLSVANIQNKLIYESEVKKAKFEQMKRNGTRLRAVGALNDPSTKITQIKQVTIKNDGKPTSEKDMNQLWHEADFAGTYVDKMSRGIFREDGDHGEPKTPKVTRMTPNQTSSMKKVTPNMTNKKKSESDEMKVVPRTAQMAGTYVDALPRGNIFSNDSKDTKIKTPTSKNLHQTTRPGKERKPTADMNRHPTTKPKGPGEPSDSMPMPSDAPPKRTVAQPKSGILVRVNESVKARFNIVSEAVLKKIVENFRQYGYKVSIEKSDEPPIWVTDKTFQTLMFETVAAKENQSMALYNRLSHATMNRLYQLCTHDYNNLYESRNGFLQTLKSAYKKIEESAVISYRKNNKLFVCNARIVNENKLSDLEILAEAVDHPTALRLVRNKIMENFGLSTEIRNIFVDGIKYQPNQIKEWIPIRVKI